MNIVIIGTGNTATILGKKFKQAGHKVVQVFGRDSKAASKLAYELGTESTNYWNVVNRKADLYLLAVSDIAVAEIIKELHLTDKTVVHTAASVSLNTLKGTAEHFGVFYPLQTLKKESGHLPEIPIIIDASDAATLEMLELLGQSISTTVVEAGDEQRLKLHLAAVIVNNFANHLYVLAEDYCRKEGLDFSILRPLITETAARAIEVSPATLQTGPAKRNDKPTLEKHLQLLENHPQLKKIYTLFTDSIQQGNLN